MLLQGKQCYFGGIGLGIKHGLATKQLTHHHPVATANQFTVSGWTGTATLGDHFKQQQ